MFANTTLTYSRYRLDNDVVYFYDYEDEPEYFNSLYFSGIDDLGVKYGLDYLPGSGHSIKIGAMQIGRASCRERGYIAGWVIRVKRDSGELRYNNNIDKK